MYLHFVSTFCLNLVWGLSNRLTESVLLEETHLTVAFSVIILVSSFFFGTKGKEENPEKLQLLSVCVKVVVQSAGWALGAEPGDRKFSE